MPFRSDHGWVSSLPKEARHSHRVAIDELLMLVYPQPVNSIPQDQLPPYLQDLNEPQREAVQHLDGPILVLAGAGSGKTRVLTRRVAHLVLKHRVNPWNILAVTFTNKATDEMRERLRGLLGQRADSLWVSTFHAAGLRILRKHAAQMSYSSDFTVYDDKDSKALLKSIVKDLRIDEKKFPVQVFARAIDWAKNNLVPPEAFAENRKDAGQTPYEAELQHEVYQRYQLALLRGQAMDFGDLLMNAVLLLQQHTDILQYYQRQLQFVLVDEFQDTNPVQYRMVRLLTEPRCNLLVVGDDDQSIYGFRGASIQNILNFEKDFLNCKVVKLEQNYRSTGNILEAAHHVIRHNKGRKAKKLWTAGDTGAPLYVFTGSDEMEEAEFVATEIERLLQLGKTLSDIAIFYRTNAQSRALEETLVSHALAYRIYGGQKFYERKEVKDILSYLRLLANEADDQAFLRVINTPPRGIGAQSVQSIIDLARTNQSPLLAAARLLAETNKQVRKFVALIASCQSAADSLFLSALIEKVIEESDYGPKLRALKDVTAQSRIENLQELEAIGRSMETEEESHRETLRRFLDRVSLTAGDESPEDKLVQDVEAGLSQKKDAVTLMTLHLAKGLEFPAVFMTGMEEGLLPHYHSLYEAEGIEEERRLCYVGITRAREVLYLTRAFSRGMFSGGGDNGGFSGGYRESSRFLHDIPEELLQPCESPYV